MPAFRESDDKVMQLLHACGHNHAERVTQLIEAGVDVNARDGDGETPLMWAAEEGARRSVETLIRLGADVNAQSGSGGTALRWAAQYGHVTVVRILLKAGADPELRNIWGQTPLITAALLGQLAVVRALVRAGARTDARDIDGMSALDCAKREGLADVVAYLSERELFDEYLCLSEAYDFEGPTPDVRARWLEVWRAYIEVDTYESLAIDVVGNFADLGWRIAAADGDFGAASDRLDRFFGHPDVANAEPSLCVTLSCARSVSLLYTGNEAAAGLLYQTLLGDERSIVNKTALLLGISRLYAYCVRRNPDHSASKELTEVVKTIAVRRRLPIRAYGRLSIEASYGELCHVLRETYPPEYREDAREAAGAGPW